MTVYKLEDWNDVISRVNDLAVNPDEGCNPVSALDPVDAPHRWAKSDIRTGIQQVQDKLREICDENDFSAIPELWQQSVLDEIDSAINRGWCNCEEDEEEHCQQDEETFVVFSAQMTCEVQGVNERPCGQLESTCDESTTGFFNWYAAATLITGFAPGIGGSMFMRRRIYNPDGTVLDTRAVYSNSFNCNGTQETPFLPPPLDGDGNLQWSQWVSNVVRCIECTPVTTKCILIYCITNPCHIGFPRCDTEMDEAEAEKAVWEEDCERYPFTIQYEVTRTPFPAFEGEGAPCNECCSDGIGYKNFGDCPEELEDDDEIDVEDEEE